MATRADSHMEESVDQGLGMEETDAGLMRRPSLGETYRSDSLLAPDTDFMTSDDRSSAASGLDVVDRLTYLEQRMQMQEDEIQLLKMTLADVLRRLNISDEHQAAGAGRRPPGAKARRPVSLALPTRTNPMVTSNAASLKKITTLPSSSTGRNYSSSPTPSKSSVKDNVCKTARTRPPSASPTTAADSSSKGKEPTVTLGTRRVTHCKVTMQIYLSPLTRRTGSSDTTKSAPVVPTSSGPPGIPQAKGAPRLQSRKVAPAFTLNLRKTYSSQNTQLDTSNYKSPIKSPSQYFQICY